MSDSANWKIFGRWTAIIWAVLILIGIALARASGAKAADTTAPSTRPDAVEIGITDFHFVPAEVTVKPGTTITWVNHDDIPHTATADGDSPLFDSKALDTDDKYSFTFTKPGTYPYYCKVHPHMRGKIIVK